MKYKILLIVYPKIEGCQYHRQTHPHEYFTRFSDFEIACKYDFNIISMDELKYYHLIQFHKNYVTPDNLSKLKRLGVISMVDFNDYWHLPTNHLSFQQYKQDNQSYKFIEILKPADCISVTTELLPLIHKSARCIAPSNSM